MAQKWQEGGSRRCREEEPLLPSRRRPSLDPFPAAVRQCRVDIRHVKSTARFTVNFLKNSLIPSFELNISPTT